MGRLSLRPNVIISDGAYSAFIIPVTGNAAGGGGTFFRSDLMIVNYRNVPQDIAFFWFPRGSSGDDFNPVARITIPANTFVSYNDVLGTVLQKSGLGAIRVEAVPPGSNFRDFDARIDGFSRIWTPQPGVNGTVSQSFPGIFTTDLGGSTDSAFVLGMRADASFRTNVGIVNYSSDSHTFTVSVNGVKGSTSFSMTLPGLSMNQTAIPPGDYGPLILQITPDSATVSWSGYGSSVDNVTGDGWTAKAQYAK